MIASIVNFSVFLNAICKNGRVTSSNFVKTEVQPLVHETEHHDLFCNFLKCSASNEFHSVWYSPRELLVSYSLQAVFWFSSETVISE